MYRDDRITNHLVLQRRFVYFFTDRFAKNKNLTEYGSFTYTCSDLVVGRQYNDQFLFLSSV